MGKNAFTFAEVMITIAIIGVVAALTMPSIVKHYHEKEYVTQLQKSVSQFEQAMQIIMFRHECTDIICTGVFDGESSNSAWNDKFEKEIINSLKVINTTKNGTALMSDIVSTPLKPRFATATEDVDWRSTSGFKFMTPDGAMYIIEPKGCVDVAHPELSTIHNFCAEVTIDVNSYRMPNQYGRDLFKFIVAQNAHLYPMYSRDYSNAFYGSDTGDNYWRTNSALCAGEGILKDAPENVSGYGCAARVIEEGWKMNY